VEEEKKEKKKEKKAKKKARGICAERICAKGIVVLG
jgi:hypothetical protein